MQIVINISKDRYDEIMSMDWKNCRLFFDEEIRAIHDGKVLEKQPCEDCISRQAVDDAIYDYSRSCDVNYAQIMEFIDKLLSVTAQPKMGKWKRISRDMYVQHAMAYYECSECGKKMIGTHNYCPNCGAKMSEIPTGAEGSDKE